MTTPWSQSQLAIFAHIEDPNSGHAQVIARAGSGKTTTLVEAANRAPEPPAATLAVAFNKKIATELEERLRPGVVCRTFNALGHRTWASYTSSRVQLKANKTFTLTKTHTADLGQSAFSATLQLVSAAKSVGLVPDKVPQPHISLIDDIESSWENLADYFDIDWSREIYTSARRVLTESVAQSFRGTIDFDDQLYMPTLFGAPFSRFDLILVDEAQDLSPLQHKMLTKSLAPGGRVLSVGDPAQAIYGFRGACAESMAMLAETFSPSVELPLTTSFRCPRAVVLEAQRDVPDIHPWENSPKGEVRTWLAWTLSDIPRGATILCRNNAPLFALAWKAIRHGIPVRMLGRDIGKGLISLVKKLTGRTPIPIPELLAKLSAWESAEVARKPRTEAVTRDKAESIRELSQGLTTTAELEPTLQALFDPKGAVTFTLSSIHRSKGLEWPHVFFLDSWRIPSRFATQEWAIQQEYNLRYVAVTRAQRTLTYINLEDLTEGTH